MVLRCMDECKGLNWDRPCHVSLQGKYYTPADPAGMVSQTPPHLVFVPCHGAQGCSR